MTGETANGYAAVDRGEILVKTVSQTALGAKINWLCIARGVFLTVFTSEEQVELLFKNNVPDGVSIKPISISIDTDTRN